MLTVSYFNHGYGNYGELWLTMVNCWGYGIYHIYYHILSNQLDRLMNQHNYYPLVI